MKNTVINYLSERQDKVVQIALALIMVLFLTIMVGVYVIARQANPILLDEQGKPRQSQTSQ
jgi:hypothetical protein